MGRDKWDDSLTLEASGDNSICRRISLLLIFFTNVIGERTAAQSRWELSKLPVQRTTENQEHPLKGAQRLINVFGGRDFQIGVANRDYH